MKSKILFSAGLTIFLFVFLCFLQTSLVQARMQQIDYNVTNDQQTQNAQFLVQTLKYEPYPVNAGDWFDVWIKIQNVGQSDAKDAQFTLIPNYPFSSDDTVRYIGIVPGTVSAHQSITKLGDVELQTNEVLLKFRVKVADNAPEGDSVLKLQVAINKNSGPSFTYDLPISIGKTKTDFDVVMQDSSSQGTSFAISNIGDNDATAVTVSIVSDGPLNITGSRASIIGNLAKGDFTTVTFQINQRPNQNELRMQIAYTDAAGIRNTIEKTVPVSISRTNTFGNGQNGTRAAATSSSSFTKYVYLVIGILAGMIVVFVYRKLRRKK